jgi:hypothetical protein
VVIPVNLKIGYESTVLSRGEACKTRLSIFCDVELVDPSGRNWQFAPNAKTIALKATSPLPVEIAVTITVTTCPTQTKYHS